MVRCKACGDEDENEGDRCTVFLPFLQLFLSPSSSASSFSYKTPLPPPSSPEFSVKRVLLRSCVMGMVMIVAFAIPDFGKILNLIGGSTVTIMSFVLPPLCFLRLNAAKELDGQPFK